jgi:hypothetical protein
MTDKARKTCAPSRLFSTKRTSKYHQDYDVLKAANSVNSDIQTDTQKDSSHLTDFETMSIFREEEETRPPATVSVKRIKVINIDKTNEIENSHQTEDAPVKPSDGRDNNRQTSVTQRLANIRVNKVSKLEQRAEDPKTNSSATYRKLSSALIPSRAKTGRVNITKISRDKTAAIHRPSTSYTGGENIVNIEKPIVEIRSIKNRSKTASFTTDDIKHTDSGVIVTRLPRTPISARSHHS